MTAAMIAKHITEEILGVTSLSLYGFGLVCQAMPFDVTGGIVGIVTQFGGLGVAVWLVYYHTTSTIPTMQKEYREEREAHADRHHEELVAIAESNRLLLSEQRQEFLAALKNVTCQITHKDNHDAR